MKIRTKILIVAAVIVVGIVGVVTRASHLQFGSRYTSPPANVATTPNPFHVAPADVQQALIELGARARPQLQPVHLFDCRNFLLAADAVRPGRSRGAVVEQQ